MKCCEDQSGQPGKRVVTIQINGHPITTMQVPAKICREPLKALAVENEKAITILDGRIEKEIILPDDDTVNIIVE